MSEEFDEEAAHSTFCSFVDDQTRKCGLWLHQKRVPLDGNDPHKAARASVVPGSLNKPENGTDGLPLEDERLSAHT